MLRRAYVRTKPYPPKKVKIVEEACELLKRYRYVFVIDLHELLNRVLQEYRLRVRRRGSVIKVIKNTLLKLAISKVYGSVSEEVGKILTGENGFLFTNENPFELIVWIERNAVMREARPGDVAQTEILIPAGGTDIGPGPVMSKFSKLKIPIRVKDGKIWIVKECVVAKPGDKISPDLADILRLLKMKPIFESLRIKGVIVGGTRVLSTEELRIDVNRYRDDLRRAVEYARNLMFNIAYPVPEVIAPLLARAARDAIGLALRLNVVTAETLPYMICRAVAEAARLAQALKV